MAAPTSVAPSSAWECIVCLSDFDLSNSAAAAQVRVLPCTDLLCTACLVGLLEGDRRSLKCPKCQKAHGVHDPTGRASAGELAQQWQTRSEWARSLKRNEEILLPASPPPAAISPVSGAPRCSEDDCSAQATHQCLDGCDFLCTEHERLAHARFPAHMRSSLVEQQRKKQLMVEAKAADKRAQEEATARRQQAAMNEFDARLTEVEAMQKRELQAFTLKCQKEVAVIEKLRSEAATRESALQKEAADFRIANAALATLRDDHRNRFFRDLLVEPSKVFDQRKEFEASLAKCQPASSHLRQQFAPTIARPAINNTFGDWSDPLPQQGRRSVCLSTQAQLPRPSAPSLPVALPQRLPFVGPFSFLSREQSHQLEGFLGATDKSFDTSQLLYKATRDGWQTHDFFRCCAEKGPTLTLIKVAQTGYIFGCYAAVAWPKPMGCLTNVPDPSGTSFMFSLANEYDRPFRMSLKDTSRAISVGGASGTSGPCFGGQSKDAKSQWIKYCNLILMSHATAANKAEANCSNGYQAEIELAYEVDEWVEEPPPDFTLDETTLAGSWYFAAAEIEVYAL